MDSAERFNGDRSIPSYDDKQASAALKQCPSCKKWFFWTHPQREVCALCHRW